MLVICWFDCTSWRTVASDRDFSRLIESLTKLKSRQLQQLVEYTGKFSGHQEIQDLVSSGMGHKNACPLGGYRMYSKSQYVHSDEPRANADCWYLTKNTGMQ